MKAPLPIVMLVLVLALLTAPLVPEAQPAGKVYRIGLLYGVIGKQPVTFEKP